LCVTCEESAKKENEVSELVTREGHVIASLNKVELWKNNSERKEKGYLVDFRSWEGS